MKNLLVFVYSCVTASPTLGEIFNPARDCPDVVDKLPEANDGFYWIAVENKVHKVQNYYFNTTFRIIEMNLKNLLN